MPRIIPLYDLEDIRLIFCDTESEILKFLRIFVQEVPKQIDKLIYYYFENDYNNVLKRINHIMPTARLMKLQRIEKNLISIKESIVNKSDHQDIEKYINELANNIQRIVNQICADYDIE